MIVDVSIDFFVDVQIYGTGRFPAALLKEIGSRKVDIYKSLKPDPDDPDMLRGSATITVKGRRSTYSSLPISNKSMSIPIFIPCMLAPGMQTSGT